MAMAEALDRSWDRTWIKGCQDLSALSVLARTALPRHEVLVCTYVPKNGNMLDDERSKGDVVDYTIVLRTLDGASCSVLVESDIASEMTMEEATAEAMRHLERNPRAVEMTMRRGQKSGTTEVVIDRRV